VRPTPDRIHRGREEEAGRDFGLKTAAAAGHNPVTEHNSRAGGVMQCRRGGEEGEEEEQEQQRETRREGGAATGNREGRKALEAESRIGHP
jgi:hypothetical protein